MVGQAKLPDLVGMLHAARLEDVQAAVALAAPLKYLQQEPGVHQRRNAQLGMLQSPADDGQVGTEGGNTLHLQEIDQPGEHRLDFQLAGRGAQIGNRIKNDDGRIEPFDGLVHSHQVHLQSVESRPGVAEFQQAFSHPLRQVEADGVHVADDLVPGFLEGEIEAALAAPAGGVDEVGGHA